VDVDGYVIIADLSVVTIGTVAAPNLGSGYVETTVTITGATLIGGGFWSVEPNNFPYNFYYHIDYTGTGGAASFLRQRQSPMRTPSRNRPIDLRQRQTPRTT
jgi:hypothetical protein